MKGAKKRLTETLKFIEESARGFDLPAYQGVKAYVDDLLTLGDMKEFSKSLSQGKYDDSAIKSEENTNRKVRRALALLAAARASRGAPLVDLRVGLQVVEAQGSSAQAKAKFDQLLTLYANECQNVTRGNVFAGDLERWGGWDAGTYRPLKVGAPIGHSGTAGPGSIGCFVTINAEIHLLSNYHVLIHKNNEGVVVQPAPVQGGTTAQSAIAVIDAATMGDPNHDAAVAKVNNGIVVDNTTVDGTAITGAAAPALNGNARKHGCATRERRMEVTSLAVPTRRGDAICGTMCTFQDIVEFTISDGDPSPNLKLQVPGDSGCLAFNDRNEGIALMSQQKTATVAEGFDLQQILQHFNAVILPPGPTRVGG